MPTKKQQTAAAKSDAITVRMFCHGLGDCFLISIPQKEARDYFILIDCGVAMGTAGETDLIKQVVQTIAVLTHDPQTQRGKVDLLVVTHEHRDHVSGFIQAEAEFAKIDFEHVWFAWTESRQDDLANNLRAKHAKETAALARAFKMAQASAPQARERLKAMAGILAFYGLGAAGGKIVDVAEAMTKAGKLGKSGPPECLMPGTVSPLPGAVKEGLAGGVRAYVLGPPHNETTLRRINPRKQDSVYEKKTHLALGMSWAWAAAMSGHASALRVDPQEQDESDFERAMPFERKWRIDLKALEKEKAKSFFKSHYLNGNKQRRIDGDWLWSGAQQLALYMESYTNNTSLVLAFELPKTKKVLLFVGDAQIGNWLSWHDIDSFKTKDGQTVSVKAETLLDKTVLYKVGHHGSHNATLRQKGLEMMKHPELVAMLPVEKIAVDRLGYGEMPLKSLVTALEKRTEGRILRLDQKWSGGKCPGTWKKGQPKARASAQKFKGGADGRPLYLECTFLDQLKPQA